MLTKSQIDKLFAARAAENLLPARLQAEEEQADGGLSPAEILRGLQERQTASVLAETMPGPEAWADYELPLPGTSQALPGQAVKGDPLTPAHSACEGAMSSADDEEAERRREHIQHEADPYPREAPEVDHVDLAELAKRYNQAVDAPSGYPAMRPVHAEQFRTRPDAPGQATPVPTAALNAAMITRPVLTDGQSRPCAPEAC